ncbi:MAG: hypothetical protein ACNS63_12260 [Candidatus Nitrospinota bacterium M3_3B_026]
MTNKFMNKAAGGFLTLLLGASLLACGEEEGPNVSSAGKSSHNAGRDCIECHNLKYAGTVYTDATASAAAAGEVIVINQDNGMTLEITADASGNFYTTEGDPSVGYTATVKGNSTGMVAKQTNGACSSSGCHDGAATPRVYKN